MTDKQKAISLLSFIKELIELKTKAVRDVSDYEKILWFHEIPIGEEYPECFSILSQSDMQNAPDTWIRIQKPHLGRRPLPPKELQPYLLDADLDNPKQYPELKNISIPPLRQEEIDELHSKLEEYVDNAWDEWATEQTRNLKVQEIYGRLHEMKQSLLKKGEELELVVGLGLLLWDRSSGMVRRHLITGRAEIEIKDTKGDIFVGPAAEGTKPVLEQDMLGAEERPAPEKLREIEEKLVPELIEGFWEQDKAAGIFSNWVNHVSARGAYYPEVAIASRATADPIIYYAPALILRKRTLRTLIAAYEEIIENVKNDLPYPKAMGRAIGLDGGDAEGRQPPDHGDEIEDILFPLPSNEDQAKIIEALNGHVGVVVQGPPGTGKSHTIANLICHLLAHGKKILVTSQTPRALRVLKGMLPEEIEALCVNLLGNDLHSFRELEGSVAGIMDKKQHWDGEKNKVEIKFYKDKLSKGRQQEALLRRNLLEVREKETYKQVIVGGRYTGTAKEIAIRIVEEKPELGWISDISLIAENPSLCNEEAVELLQLMRTISSEMQREALQTVCNPSDLMPAIDYSKYCMAEHEASSQSEQYSAMLEGIPKDKLLLINDQDLDRLIDGVGKILKAWESLSKYNYPWLAQALDDILAEKDRRWSELLEMSKEHLSGLMEKAKANEAFEISKPDDIGLVRMLDDAQLVLEHLKAGRKLSLLIFKPKNIRNARYIFENVFIDGKPCNTVDRLQILIRSLSTERALSQIWKYWAPYAPRPQCSIREEIRCIEDLCEPLEDGLEIFKQKRMAQEACERTGWLKPPIWHDRNNVSDYFKKISAIKAYRRLHEAKQPIEAMRKAIYSLSQQNNVHEILRSFIIAIDQRNIKTFSGLLEGLEMLQDLRQRTLRLFELRDRLKIASPNLLAALEGDLNNPQWEDRLKRLEDSWFWSAANAWLSEFIQREDEDSIAESLENIKNANSRFTRELAAKKAWQCCIQRLTDPEIQHLKAWALAIRMGGKWKGKNAEKHRREAREHLAHCQTAIPAWVMPLYKVAENFPRQPGIFDVGIIDEASQSWVEALFITYLCKKVIVVGDEHQIAPSNIGILQNDVEQLRKRYLDGIPAPVKTALDLNSSFFALATIMYKQMITLLEHFRCMPEIIQFSNELCYHEKLKPLRQYPPEHLMPLVAINVQDGYREGSQQARNEPEARALVDVIAKCCKDKQYDGKTMGMISLQGEAQAELIGRLLLSKIGATEIKARGLLCGDAYSFQGDERDIIFLSMVAGGSETTLRALTSTSDMRRFNVAASRAKDQMWLLHTPTINDFRNKEDLRYRLLEYFIRPKVQRGLAFDLDELDRSAQAKQRKVQNPPSPFDSWFEVDVFLRIAKRGYKIIPQFESAHYRIDMVVEGARARLAVECDGDAVHGTEEQLEKDAIRQKILERCGWRFFRVLASEYYYDPEKALNPLWEKLNLMGIDKGGRDIKGQHESSPKAETHNDEEQYEEPKRQANAVQDDENATQADKLTPSDLERAIVEALQACPKGTCTKKSITSRACRCLGIITRGKPRELFEKRIYKALSSLVQKGVVEEYKSKNERLRLKSESTICQRNLF